MTAQNGLHFKLPEIPSGAHRFDVQSIFIVAFQCNKNLPGFNLSKYLASS